MYIKPEIYIDHFKVRGINVSAYKVHSLSFIIMKHLYQIIISHVSGRKGGRDKCEVCLRELRLWFTLLENISFLVTVFSLYFICKVFRSKKSVFLLNINSTFSYCRGMRCTQNVHCTEFKYPCNIHQIYTNSTNLVQSQFMPQPSGLWEVLL